MLRKLNKNELEMVSGGCELPDPNEPLTQWDQNADSETGSDLPADYSHLEDNYDSII